MSTSYRATGLVVVVLAAATVGCTSTRHGLVPMPGPDASVDSEDARGDGPGGAAPEVASEGGAAELDDSAADVAITADAGIDAGGDASLDVAIGLDLASGSDLAVGGEVASQGGAADAVGYDLGLDASPLPSGGSIVAATLPSPRHEAAVFSDGQAVYVAGGLENGKTVLSQILRYGPADGTISVMADALPTPTYAAGVAWTGSAAYLFGGLGQTGVLAQIVRYVPGSAATVMAAQLPKAAYNVAAVAAGSKIYVVGGQNGGSLTQILAYDVAADTLTTMATTLSVGVEATALFWDGKLVWMLGGKVNTTGAGASGTDAILTFDPASGQLSAAGHLPYAVWDPASFTDGKLFYIAGGSLTTTTGNTSVIGFDPLTRTASYLSFVLPVRLTGRVGTWVSSVGAAFLCGGADFATGAASDRIIRVVP